MLKRDMKNLFEQMDEIFDLKSGRNDFVTVITMVEALDTRGMASPYLNGVIYEFTGQFTTITKLELEGYAAGYYEYQVRCVGSVVFAVTKIGRNSYSHAGATGEQIGRFLAILKGADCDLYDLPFDPIADIFDIHIDGYTPKN